MTARKEIDEASRYFKRRMERIEKALMIEKNETSYQNLLKKKRFHELALTALDNYDDGRLINSLLNRIHALENDL